MIQAAFVQAPPVFAIDADPAPVIDEPIPVRDGPRPAALADITIPPGGSGTGNGLDPSIGAREILKGTAPPKVATEVASARTERAEDHVGDPSR